MNGACSTHGIETIKFCCKERVVCWLLAFVTFRR
jgi:hypothetical protein